MILLKNKDKKANIKIGNNIEIKDGNDFPFDLTLYGKSTQATRSGKNLFTKQGNATPKTDTTFWNGITSTTPESDGWCKVSVDNTNGTATVFANQFTKRNTIDKLEVNKTYSILVEVRNLTMSGSSSTPPYLQLCETAKESVWQGIQNYDLTIFNETNKVVFQKLTKTNFDSSLLDFRNFVSVPKGYKVEFEYRLMVVKGSYTLDTIGEYEPYGVMPSPDYPSPIESVGRKNLFDYSKLNNDNTIQWTAYSNVGTVFRALPIYVGKNKKVYFSSNVPVLTSGNAFYAINNINEGSSNILNVDNPRVISSNSDGYVYLGVVTNRQYYEDVQNNVYWIMISTDNIEYLPYEHTEISATVTGKNLLENKTKNSGISRGITFTLNGDGSYTLNGTNDGTGNATVFLSSSSNPTTLKAGTYYTIPTPNGVHITGAKIGGGYFQFASSSTSQFTLNEDIQAQIYIQVPNGITTTYNNIKVYPMISTTPITQTDYEQYKSNSLTINLQGNELCSLPNGVKDEVNITNGEALLIKRVGKVVLNGSESWRKVQIGTTGKYYFTFTPSCGQQTTNGKLLYCDYFVPSNTWSEQVVGMWLDTNMIVKTQGSLDNTEDLTSFKTWLSTHNVEVLYELAEPETINLGTVEMPHTYEGVSNITNSADTEMVVKYYKKFEFDKILRSGYNIDEQEYEIAKKQMANGKRKKILSSYVDCIIKIDLGLLDNKTYQEYKEQLEDGEYEYWSYKYNQYKKANFILTKPSITTEYAYDDEIGIDDMEITLEKSSDVS